MPNQSTPEKSGKIYEDSANFFFDYAGTRYKVWKSAIGVAKSIYLADQHVVLHKPDHTADYLQLICANVIQAMRLKDYVALNYIIDDCILFKFDNELFTVAYKAKEHDMWVVLPDGRVLEPQWQSESLPSFWKQIEKAKFIQHVGNQTVADIHRR